MKIVESNVTHDIAKSTLIDIQADCEDEFSNFCKSIENVNIGVLCIRNDKAVSFANHVAIKLLDLEKTDIQSIRIDDFITYKSNRRPLAIDEYGSVICDKNDELIFLNNSVLNIAYNIETSGIGMHDNKAIGTVFYFFNKYPRESRGRDDLFSFADEIFEVMGIGVSFINPKMEILYLNQRMKSWFPHVDCQSKPICYKSFNAPPRDDLCTYCPSIKAFSDGKTHKAITSTPSANGIIHYEILATPFRDDQGDIIGVIEVVEDVTKKHQYEIFIKTRNEYLSSVVGLTNSRAIAKLTFDHIKNILPCDCGSIVIFRRDSEDTDSMELIYSFDSENGLSEEESLCPITEVRIKAESNTVNVISSGEKLVIHRTDEELKNTVIDEDKRLKYSNRPSASLVYVPLKIHGNTIGVLSVQSYSPNTYFEKAISLLEIVAADLSMALTAARSAEISRRSEERWRSYVENAPYGVFIADCNGNFQRANSEACRMTGYSLSEMLSMNFTDLLTADSLIPGKESFLEIFKTGRVFTELGYHTKNEENRFLSVAAVRLSDEEFVGFVIDISDRKRAENQLYQSRQMLQLVIDSIPVGVFWKDKDFRYLGCNQKIADDTALGDKQEIIGKTDYDLPWNALAESYRGDDKTVMESGIPKLNYEEKLIRPDGFERWVQTNKIPIRDQNGSVFGILGTYDDITDRKLAQKRIQLDNLRMDALLNIHKMGDRSIKDINLAVVENAISVTESKICYLAMVKEDDSAHIIQYWPKATDASCPAPDNLAVHRIEETDLWREAIRLRKPIIINNYSDLSDAEHGLPNGYVPITRLMNIPVIAEDKIVAVLGVGNKETDYNDDDIRQLQLFMDGWWQIMKRIEAEIKLNASKDLLMQTISQYTTMINSVPALMYVKNLEQKYTVINDAFAAFTGLPYDQIIGKTSFDILPADIAKILQKFDQNVFDGVIPINYPEEQMKNCDGVIRWLSITIIPLHGFRDELIGLVGFAQDVTEYRQSRQQLIQSDKLAAIGTLAAGVAHEINNPIGYVSSNLNTMSKYLKKIGQYLEDGSPADESIKMTEMLADFEDAIKESIEGSVRVRNIVADLKSFSRVDRTERELADINDGIKSTLNIVWNELKYKCQVEQELGDIPDLFCIPNQLNQVFMNILVNAGQAIEQTPGIIKIKTWADEQNIYVSIKDNGMGIRKEIKGKVFEPFFTTKDVGKGTGLGLSLSYDIIKKHNGTIDINSELGLGTEFVITLPLEGLSES